MGKLIFLDIDGTAVSHKTDPSSIPEPTREAVRLLMRNGHAVAFATGRSRATARLPMEELGIAGGVLSNGAHILLGGRTAFLSNLPAPVARKAARHAAQGNFTAYAADEDFVFLYNASEENTEYLRSQAGAAYVKPFSQMGRVCKFEYYGGGPEGLADGRAQLLEAYGGWELRPRGACKEEGIRRFAELAGFSMADVIAVGDERNDIGMLRAAAVGVAVGGAPEAVKAVAGVVTDPIEDGGIYKVFKHLGLI